MNCPEHSDSCGCGGSGNPHSDEADLAKEEPGSVWYSVVSEPWPGIDFLIREKSAEIAAISDCKGMQVRAGSVDICGVLVGLVLFNFRESGNVYTTAWDCYSGTEDGVNPCEILSGPAKLCFRFVGDSGDVEQTLIFESALASFFRHLCARSRTMAPWSRQQFSNALAEIYTQFPDTNSLWQKFAD
jgi:hypothetical protein